MCEIASLLIIIIGTVLVVIGAVILTVMHRQNKQNDRLLASFLEKQKHNYIPEDQL